MKLLLHRALWLFAFLFIAFCQGSPPSDIGLKQVEGFVLQNGNNAPIPNAIVSIMDASTSSDLNGHYILGEMFGRNEQIKADHPLYIPYQQPVTLYPEAINNWNVYMMRNSLSSMTSFTTITSMPPSSMTSLPPSSLSSTSTTTTL